MGYELSHCVFVHKSTFKNLIVTLLGHVDDTIVSGYCKVYVIYINPYKCKEWAHFLYIRCIILFS